MYGSCDEKKLEKKQKEVASELRELTHMHSLSTMQKQFANYIEANIDDFIECYYEEEIL